MFIRKLDLSSKTQIFNLGFFLIVSSLIITSTFLSVDIASKTNDDLPVNDFKMSNYSDNTNDEYSLDYTLIEHFVTGETEVRDVNSLDSESMMYSVSESTAEGKEDETAITIGGSDEVVLITNNLGGWGNPNLRNKLFHIEDNNMMHDPDSSHLYDAVHLDSPETDNLYYGGPEVVSDITVGNVDGNFREEVIVAYGRDNKLTVQILENWAGLQFQIMANGTGGPMDQSAIAITSGNFDSDDKDEFAILGVRPSGPQIWVYDDIATNTPNDIMCYGDKLILKTFSSPDSFLYSPEYPTTGLYPNNMGASAISSQMTFTILKADNQNFTGPVEYGDEVLLQDADGRYWITDDSTNKVTIADYDMDSHNLTDYTFRVLSERPGGEAIGVVYFNGFVAFQSNLTTEYAYSSSGNCGLTSDPRTPSAWFKVHSADYSRPNIYFSSAEPINTIYLDDIITLDNLPRTNPTDLDFHLMPSNIATGDVDGDNISEIIVIGMDASSALRAYVFDDLDNNLEELHEFSWASTNINPSVTTGDIDGDLKDEILFSLTTASSGKIEVYNDASNGYSLLHTIQSVGSSLYGTVSRITTGDIDGDFKDEIVFASGSCFLSVYDDNYTRLTLIDNQHYHEVDVGIIYNQYKPVDLMCGDINQDGEDDILFSSFEATSLDLTSGHSSGFFSTWSYNASDNDFNYKSKTFVYWDFPPVVVEMPRLVCGDFNADQFIVKYLDHKTWTAEEQIVVVMAAPPTHDGLSQNYGESGTEYGYSVSSGTSGSVGASIGIGAYVAYEKELEASFFFSIKLAKFEAEASLMAKAGVSRSKSFVQVKTSAFAGDGSYDYVVFTAIKYDRFIYQVLSSPDSSLEGSNMSVLYPQEVKLYKWDREYYNSHNSENAEDIGNSILGHTIGDVTTYPTYGEVAAAHSERMESNIMPVGKGAGTTIVEVAFSTEVEIEIEAELEFEWKIGAGVGDFTFGLMGSIGAQMGWGWSWGEETSFVGEVGDIEEAEDYQAFNYDYGLYVSLHHYTPKAQKDFEPDGVVGVADDVLELLGTLSSLHMDEFDRGNGYYVISYWVNTPEYFGLTIQEEIEYASDIDHVITKFEIPGFTLLTLLPLFLFGVRKKYTTKCKEK